LKRQRTYTGIRKPDGTTAVLVDRTAVLPLRLDLRQLATHGFEWGYGEGGAAQLALALLADHLDDDDRALALYSHVKRHLIWTLPALGWTLTGAEIEAVIKKIEAQSARERLSDLLGLVMKATCHACGRRRTFWARSREMILRQIDDSGWVEGLDADGEVHFKCGDCLKR
jgi:hypothetical protein